MITIPELYEVFRTHPLISTDSRNVPAGCIFFALKGEQFNGNSFALQAIEKGAAYAVVDEDITGDHCLRTADVLVALQQLARHHRMQMAIPFLAITGSNGKTTTKELVHAVLSTTLKTYATKGNLNNHIGVPLSLLAVTANHEMAVIEMGANHLHEIELLCSLAMPTHGLVTNVGKAHLEGFGGFEGVKKGKGELYDYIASSQGKLFINSDNPHLADMSKKSGIVHSIRYGTTGRPECSGDLVSGLPFLEMKWRFRKQSGHVRSQLTGSYNFENVLAAVCIGNYFGVPAEQIDAAIESYVPTNSRSQQVVIGSNTLILDAYNANPTSMTEALKNFAAMNQPRKIIFLGEMAELGEESEREHQAIADLIAAMSLDEVVLVGKNFKGVNPGRPFIHFDTSEQAAEFVKGKNYEHTAFLIKGSRSTKMEKVLEAL